MAFSVAKRNRASRLRSLRVPSSYGPTSSPWWQGLKALLSAALLTLATGFSFQGCHLALTYASEGIWHTVGVLFLVLVAIVTWFILTAATTNHVTDALGSFSGYSTYRLARKAVKTGIFKPTWTARGRLLGQILMVDEDTREFFVDGRFYDLGQIAEIIHTEALGLRIAASLNRVHWVYLRRQDLSDVVVRLTGAIANTPLPARRPVRTASRVPPVPPAL